MRVMLYQGVLYMGQTVLLGLMMASNLNQNM